VVLFSDGVPEAQDEAGEEFGEERLAALVAEQSAASERIAAVIVDRIFTALDAFAGAAPQYDDITVLVTKRA
jgi:phosphoserine phosphatase RsbU/P